MVEHTPGPWNFIRGDGYVVAFYGTVNVRRVADKPEGNLTNWTANARLIAAAPELLAALQTVSDGPHDAEAIADMLPSIRAAIAKATAKAEGDGWTEWNGGECPVDPTGNVDIRFRIGSGTRHERAGDFDWNHLGGPGDIIAYRLANASTTPEKAS